MRHTALGPAWLVLYDVTTLDFEADTGDRFREPGFSQQRRLEPQITVGLLTDAAGFALMAEAFEGNKAETTTMLPTITAFMAAHQLPEVIVVADAEMISASNKKAIEEAGLSFILGAAGNTRGHAPRRSRAPGNTPRLRGARPYPDREQHEPRNTHAPAGRLPGHLRIDYQQRRCLIGRLSIHFWRSLRGSVMVEVWSTRCGKSRKL